MSVPLSETVVYQVSGVTLRRLLSPVPICHTSDESPSRVSTLPPSPPMD